MGERERERDGKYGVLVTEGVLGAMQNKIKLMMKSSCFLNAFDLCMGKYGELSCFPSFAIFYLWTLADDVMNASRLTKGGLISSYTSALHTRTHTHTHTHIKNN